MSTHPTGRPDTAVETPDLAGAPSRVVPLWVCVVLAAAFTAVMIQKGLGYGRLSVIPTYDDVTYLKDAAWRVKQLYVDGIDHFLATFFERRPHSPYVAVTAIIGFVLMGIRDWAPYVVNGVNVLAALLVVRYATQPLSRSGFLFSAALLLGLPATGSLVLHLRPDAANGVFTAAAMLLLLQMPPDRDDRWSAVLPGAIFGLVLLTKPSVFLMTLVLYGGTAAWWLARTALIERRPKKSALKRIGIVLATTAVVAGWFYILHWRHYWDYFYQFTFGRLSDQTETKTGDLAFHLLYYLGGDGGWFMFGNLALWLGAVLVLGVVLLVLTGNRARLWLLAQTLGLLGAAWAIPSVTSLKNPFFGATFAFMLVLVTVLAWAPLLARDAPRRRTMLTVALTLWLVPVTLRFVWPFDNSPLSFWHPATASARTDAKLANINDLMTDLYGTMRAYQSVERMHVALNGEGTLTSELFNYWAARDMTHQFVFYKASYRDHWGNALDDTRMAIVIETESDLIAPHLPSYHASAGMLDAVRQRPDMLERVVLESYSGGRVHVFDRITDFTGWHLLDGLHGEDDIGTPDGIRLFRQTMAHLPVTAVAIPASHPRNVVIELEARAMRAGQRIRVGVADTHVGAIELPAPKRDMPFVTAWAGRATLPPGEQILTLRLDDASNQVRYLRLRVLPLEATLRTSPPD